ncbi:MAG: hypothetical protein ACO1OC_07950, partial [Tuberibacillus sp.]
TWSLCRHDYQARKSAYQWLASPNKAIMPASPCKVGLRQILLTSFKSDASFDLLFRVPWGGD